jgi:hypothetical protein
MTGLSENMGFTKKMKSNVIVIDYLLILYIIYKVLFFFMARLNVYLTKYYFLSTGCGTY